MTITYRTAGAWGAGVGRPLTWAELDENFYDLDTRVTDLENGGGSAHIVGFSVSGDQFYVNMSDSSQFGPFTLPGLALNFRGTWEPSTSYFTNDILTFNGNVYLVLLNHVSASSFDPNANSGSGFDWYGLLLSNPASIMPSGGTTGQVLAKNSNSDYDTHWVSSGIPTGGTAGQLLVKQSGADYAIAWTDPSATFSIALSDLTDTAVASSPNVGDALTWDGTYWVNTPSAARGTVSFTNGNNNYTPQTGDEFTFVLFTFVGTVTITVPNNSAQDFPIDSELTFVADSAGTVVHVVGDTGVTLEKPDGYLAQSLGRNAVMTIKKVGINRWKLFGLLAPDV